jgi:glycylpeptide N-tetradecanoyltransferase
VSNSKNFPGSIFLSHCSWQKLIKDPKNPEEIRKLKEKAALYKKHVFWDTQPVVHLSTDKPGNKCGPIEAKEVKDVRSIPLQLPDGFEWTAIDLTNDKEMEEVFELLKENYVEDTDNMFRFKYSIEFLRWALMIPGYKKEWILGCRVIKNKKLIGFITGIPTNVVADGDKKLMAEINFLCVHKKLRTKRLAPVLIKEVTRRVNMTNVWQAVYTAGKYIPTPFSEALYYHRLMNVKKLLDINFCGMPHGSNFKRYEKLNKMPDMPEIPGFRRMGKKDAKKICELLKNYLK